ncbi:hypothetical protein Y032_1277g3800 [Ancylostoma ceylanicum]|uniref:Uncharacterized protein n=1 Tax=Ancylostoma ceylanicum TaxID=53326 RepID=A0A016W6J7_9BILA|nr:hypothetical protein Y032_1277g3800 [Ancylostoma ceylanicum]
MGAIAWATSFSIRIDCRRYAPGDCPSIIVGVDSGDPSAASKSTRRDCAARAGVPSRTTKYGVFLTATQTLMGAMSSDDSIVSGAVAPRSFRGRGSSPPSTPTVLLEE